MRPHVLKFLLSLWICFLPVYAKLGCTVESLLGLTLSAYFWSHRPKMLVLENSWTVFLEVHGYKREVFPSFYRLT